MHINMVWQYAVHRHMLVIMNYCIHVTKIIASDINYNFKHDKCKIRKVNRIKNNSMEGRA